MKEFSKPSPQSPNRGLGYWSVLGGLRGGSVIGSLTIILHRSVTKLRGAVVCLSAGQAESRGFDSYCGWFCFEGISFERLTENERPARMRKPNKCKQQGMHPNEGLGYWGVLLSPWGRGRLFGHCSVGGRVRWERQGGFDQAPPPLRPCG